MTEDPATDRLVFERPGPAHAPAYIEFFADEDASRWYGGPLRPDQAWRRLAEDVGHWHLHGFGIWMLRLRESAAVVGGCGLWHPQTWPLPELTWWLLPGARGTGLATEASRAVIDHATRFLGWQSVPTFHDDANLAAARMVERLGGVEGDRIAFPDGVERIVWHFRP
jgi:RimJ/RimL family protein N-acetyltransferase